MDADARGSRVFARFVGRLGDAATEPAVEASRRSHDAIAGCATGGALFARTSWWDGERSATGCFLWIGAVATMLGGAPGTPAAALDAADVRALEEGLRARAERERDLELQWSELVPVAPDDLVDVLRQAGIPDPCDVREIRFLVGGEDSSFLFLVSGQGPAGAPDGIAAPGFRNLPHLLDVRIPLTVRLGSARMTLDDVLRLAAGSVVELDRREDEPLEILANGRVVARGEVVVVDERFAVRITGIGAPEERVRTGRAGCG
jgi:flagellar motor switch protein FliN